MRFPILGPVLRALLLLAILVAVGWFLATVVEPRREKAVRTDMPRPPIIVEPVELRPECLCEVDYA